MSEFWVGVGIGDITGPAAEINLNGYGSAAQTSHGIHLRQFSRAFIFAKSPSSPRVVFVCIEACWCPGSVKREVIRQLQAEYGHTYAARNLAISATHTHAGAGGYSQLLLYDLPALGFIEQSFQALVDGILESIRRAHDSLQPADLFLNVGELLDSSINRSPSAYLNNPAEERQQYTYDVDREMTVLKIVDKNRGGLGMISWFPVHCTSMTKSNQLLSSDNKGYASLLFEQLMNGDVIPGRGSFVAAFAQSDSGDVSPNTRGPHCLDSGLTCDTDTDTCDGQTSKCVSQGPGTDMFESTKIIGRNQFFKALELYSTAQVKLSGPVDFRHTYVDMPRLTVSLPDGQQVQLCKPAMGYSFAAGTTDGPGPFDFQQGTTSESPLWNLIRNLIKEPSRHQTECHRPKPILLDTGELEEPYLWQPQIVDHQILRIGQLVILAVPAEFTTMSGRRLRKAVYSTLVQQGLPENFHMVVAGPTNEYSSYVTTFQEYQVQRYEGASTIYGPHTLEGYLQSYSRLAAQMAQGLESEPGPQPPNQQAEQLTLRPGVVFDSTPLGTTFGSVLVDAEPFYTQGSTVVVRFVSANPRNDLRRNDTFLTVEQQHRSGGWVVKYTDAHWETKFRWLRTSTVLGWSEAEILWDIPPEQTPGSYRIRHLGTSKSFLGWLTPFQGLSRQFQVFASPH